MSALTDYLDHLDEMLDAPLSLTAALREIDAEVAGAAEVDGWIEPDDLRRILDRITGSE